MESFMEYLYLSVFTDISNKNQFKVEQKSTYCKGIIQLSRKTGQSGCIRKKGPTSSPPQA